MKKIVWIIFCILSLFACKKESNSFTIEGNIRKIGNDTVYIYTPESMEKSLDTIIVTKNKFEYKAHIDTVKPFLLLIRGKEYPVFAEKGLNVSVTGEISKLEDLKIEGGIFNKEMNEFRKTGLPAEEKETILSKAENFIRSHPFSPVSIYLLDKYFVQQETPDFIKITDLIQSMSGELQDNKYIKRINEIATKQNTVAPDKYLPSFSLKNQKGNDVTSANFKNRYLFIHFWASWDLPSTEENILLKSLWEKYKKEKKFAFLGVSLDLNRQDWINAIQKDTLDWEQVTDFKGWENSMARQYGIEELPSNLLVAPDRKIIGKNLEIKELTEKIEELLKETSSNKPNK